jgi:hypothetical protein
MSGLRGLCFKRRRRRLAPTLADRPREGAETAHKTMRLRGRMRNRIITQNSQGARSCRPCRRYKPRRLKPTSQRCAATQRNAAGARAETAVIAAMSVVMNAIAVELQDAAQSAGGRDLAERIR